MSWEPIVWPSWLKDREHRPATPEPPEEAVSLSCARCSGGVGLLCDKCVLEVAAAAIRTLEEAPSDPA